MGQFGRLDSRPVLFLSVTFQHIATEEKCRASAGRSPVSVTSLRAAAGIANRLRRIRYSEPPRQRFSAVHVPPFTSFISVFFMSAIISIENLCKTYPPDFQALKSIDLQIRTGEIFALLGPNGAGKTTLISIVCGLVNPSAGRVLVAGHDNRKAYRQARSRIGLVPQELTTDAFETVWDTVSFSRGLFGRAPNPAHIERTLRDLSLWNKRDNQMRELSGGMKRRVMIAKALAHEPEILFLDEPTAGVDVELRRDMWQLVRGLRARGVTIILTTHYIEEAEEMADRIGVIRQGELILVDDKRALMQKLGQKRLSLSLQRPLAEVPPELAPWKLTLAKEGHELWYAFEASREQASVSALLRRLAELDIGFRDLNTSESSLEEIFVRLVQAPAEAHA